MLCTNCKKENQDNFNFCRCCGSKHNPSDLDLLDKAKHKLDWQFCLTKGIELTEERKFYDALEYLDLGVQLNPNEPSIYNARGKCKQKILFCPELRFKHKEASEDFYKAQELDRTNIETLFNIGNIQLMLKDYWEAFGAFDEILDQQPLNIKALDGAAFSKCCLGEFEDANKLILKALKIVPDNKTALSTYARTLVGLYEFKKGVTILKKLIKQEFNYAKNVLNGINPIQYLIITEVKNKGFVLAVRDNEIEAKECQTKAFDFINKYQYDKTNRIITGIKYITSYNVKENPKYLNDIIFNSKSDDFFVSVIKFDAHKFSLKAFKKSTPIKKTIYHKYDIEDADKFINV